MGNKVQFGFMIGKPLSGKTTLSKDLEKNHNYVPIDMKTIQQSIKESKGTEEGPYEGDIPIGEVEAACMDVIKKCKGQKFVFDDYLHTDDDHFI